MFTDSKLTIYTAGVEAPLLANSAASGPEAGALLLTGKLEDECQSALETLEKVLWFDVELKFSGEMDKP